MPLLKRKANTETDRAQTLDQPKPSSTVPFMKDTTFIGREDVLREIKKINRPAIVRQHERIALVGPAGIG